MTWRPEDFEDLAGHLRRQIGSEFREEAEEVERLTELQRRRKQTMSDVATKAMHAGDGATVAIGSRRWQGSIVGVGDDYLILNTNRTVIEAPFLAITLRLERSRSGGNIAKPLATTWVARLAELAMAEEHVTLVTVAEELEGQIVLLATDHIEFEGSVYVSIVNVKAVIRSVD